MEAIPEGHYAKKQLGCDSRVIAWSHRTRFETAVRLVGSDTAGKLMDYGCGDGTFLVRVAPQFAEVWGSDIDAGQLADCEARISPRVPNVHFCPLNELHTLKHDHAYAVVTCMETLEHCIAPVVETVLRDLTQLCAPDGKVIISVPIETGPSFAIKYAVRKVAGWRRLSDYRNYENYSMKNAAKMVFATGNTIVDRPAYGEPGALNHSHYGFNWRALRKKVREYLHVDRTLFTPLGMLGGLVSSQAWMICRPRAAASKG